MALLQQIACDLPHASCSASGLIRSILVFEIWHHRTRLEAPQLPTNRRQEKSGRGDRTPISRPCRKLDSGSRPF